MWPCSDPVSYHLRSKSKTWRRCRRGSSVHLQEKRLKLLGTNTQDNTYVTKWLTGTCKWFISKKKKMYVHSVVLTHIVNLSNQTWCSIQLVERTRLCEASVILWLSGKINACKKIYVNLKLSSLAKTELAKLSKTLPSFLLRWQWGFRSALKEHRLQHTGWSGDNCSLSADDFLFCFLNP